MRWTLGATLSCNLPPTLNPKRKEKRECIDNQLLELLGGDRVDDAPATGKGRTRTHTVIYHATTSVLKLNTTALAQSGFFTLSTMDNHAPRLRGAKATPLSVLCTGEKRRETKNKRLRHDLGRSCPLAVSPNIIVLALNKPRLSLSRSLALSLSLSLYIHIFPPPPPPPPPPVTTCLDSRYSDRTPNLHPCNHRGPRERGKQRVTGEWVTACVCVCVCM